MALPVLVVAGAVGLEVLKRKSIRRLPERSPPLLRLAKG
jgi:hypothetical protein